jgi:hypothetical protein
MIRYKANKYDDTFAIGRVNNISEFNDIAKDSMKQLIESFNQEYKWDGMFSYEDIIERLESNHNLFILFFNKHPIGYVFFKELDSTTTFLYNLYVSHKIDRDNSIPLLFVNIVCAEMFDVYDDIELECEDWNTAAQKLFESVSFKKIND